MKHIVGSSGGADSQACALWVRQRFPAEDVILLNTDAGGNEHPITSAFIAWYSETIHPVITISPTIADMGNKARAKIAELGLAPDNPLTFDRLAELKGRYPSRKAQFCTEHLKLFPQRRWLDEHFPPRIVEGVRYPTDAFERYNGVRRDESDHRSDALDREYDEFYGCYLNRPLVRWTKPEVFAYLKAAGEEVNPLYRMGFERVGCAPCINSKKEDIRLWAVQAPEMIDKVRAWEQRVGRTFFPPIIPRKIRKEDRKPLPDETPKQTKKRLRSLGRRHAFIDEVVEWAKTERGGRQYSLPVLESVARSGACMSKYEGLCE